MRTSRHPKQFVTLGRGGWDISVWGRDEAGNLGLVEITIERA
ncbi:MAG: hypothetical protein AB1486_33185 [Planctomycetota bacterium]